jgi:NhaA family Na+:H+ antiporter
MMSRVLHYILDHALAVPIGASVALIWANTFSEDYFRLSTSLAFWVNDVGMAFFFAYAMQEVIETMVSGGALHTWRRATLPVVAAVGGCLGAVTAYELFVMSGDETILRAGWPIVCGVDAGISYFLVKSLVRGKGATAFLLLLAIASNTIGLVVVGFREPLMDKRPVGILLIAVAMVLAIAFQKLRFRSFWPHLLIAGTLSWAGFAITGLHPALALLPIVPFFPHAARNLDLFSDAPHSAHDSPGHFEHVFRVPVQVVLFLFALVNAGVLMRGYGTGSWAILWGSLAGRPLGILLSVGVAVALGFHLPQNVGWRALIVIAAAASIGFVFTLFYATAMYAVGNVLQELKTGAVLTLLGGAIVFLLARALRVGRFA